MHPIFSHLRRLGLYLLAWIPIAGMLAYLLTIPGQITMREAVTLSIPLSLIYAFVCLSSWYSCRGNSLEKYGLGRLVTTHVTAALIASIVWAFVAVGMASSLSKLPAFTGLSARFRPEIPVIVGSGLLLYLLSVTFFYIIIAVDLSRDAEARVMRASVLARDAELRALKAQVNPHFFFNTLNNLYYLATIKSDLAPLAISKLSEVMRYMIYDSNHEKVELAKEIEYMQHYIGLERLRLKEGIPLDFEFVGRTDILITPLILIAFLENAFKHGVSNGNDQSWIKARLEVDKGRLTFRIGNSKLRSVTIPADEEGIGLKNVKRRLDLSYPGRYKLDIEDLEDCFFVDLTIDLP